MIIYRASERSSERERFISAAESIDHSMIETIGDYKLCFLGSVEGVADAIRTSTAGKSKRIMIVTDRIVDGLYHSAL